MRPVVIDTNCLLQMISRNSPYRPIWDAFLAGKYELCVSNDILEEYQEILEQQITPTVAENIVLLLLNKQNVKLVDPHFRMGLITADPDDPKNQSALWMIANFFHKILTLNKENRFSLYSLNRIFRIFAA